jgi:hypothetical protein
MSMACQVETFLCSHIAQSELLSVKAARLADGSEDQVRIFLAANFFAVVEIPPAKSASDGVRASIMADAKNGGRKA